MYIRSSPDEHVGITFQSEENSVRTPVVVPLLMAVTYMRAYEGHLYLIIASTIANSVEKGLRHLEMVDNASNLILIYENSFRTIFNSLLFDLKLIHGQSSIRIS